MPKAERAKLYGQLIDEAAAKLKAINDGSFLAELQTKAATVDAEQVLSDFFDYLYNNDHLINEVCMVELAARGLDLKDTTRRKELQKDINQAALLAPQTIDDICQGLDKLIKNEASAAPLDAMLGTSVGRQTAAVKQELLQAALLPTMFERIYELIGEIVNDYEEMGKNINYNRAEMDDGWEDMKFYRRQLQNSYSADPRSIVPQLVQLITYGSQRISGNEVKV